MSVRADGTIDRGRYEHVGPNGSSRPARDYSPHEPMRSTLAQLLGARATITGRAARLEVPAAEPQSRYPVDHCFAEFARAYLRLPRPACSCRVIDMVALDGRHLPDCPSATTPEPRVLTLADFINAFKD